MFDLESFYNRIIADSFLREVKIREVTRGVRYETA